MTEANERRRRLAPPERRLSIVTAAAEVFGERDAEDVSVAEVAAAAGVSEALVYHYLPSRSELYAAAVELRLRELTDAALAAIQACPPNTAAREIVRQYLLARLERVRTYRRAWSTSLAAMAEPGPAQTVRAAVRAEHVAFLSDLLRDDPSPRDRLAVLAFLAALDATLAHWAEGGCDQDEQWPLVEVALGALQGALGDWGR